MNQRERLSGHWSSAAWPSCVVGLFVQGWIAGAVRPPAAGNRAPEERAEMPEFDAPIRAGRRPAQNRRIRRRARCRPNPDVARSLYHNWLLAEMEQGRADRPDVKFDGHGRGTKTLFVKQDFDVEAKGTLPQVVELLHAFYSVDWLHRITRFIAQAGQGQQAARHHDDGRSAVAEKAPASTDLVPRPAQRLRLAGQAGVLRRDRRPQSVRPAQQRAANLDQRLEGGDVSTGRWSCRRRATDPDPLDQVHVPAGRVGRPRRASSMPAAASSAGRPGRGASSNSCSRQPTMAFRRSRPIRSKIVVNVSDPPPPMADTRPPPRLRRRQVHRAHRPARYRRPGEVWLHVRPTGQMVTLHKGDQFEIGSIKGTVAQIGESDFCLRLRRQAAQAGEGRASGAGQAAAPKFTAVATACSRGRPRPWPGSARCKVRRQ